MTCLRQYVTVMLDHTADRCDAFLGVHIFDGRRSGMTVVASMLPRPTGNDKDVPICCAHESKLRCSLGGTYITVFVRSGLLGRNFRRLLVHCGGGADAAGHVARVNSPGRFARRKRLRQSRRLIAHRETVMTGSYACSMCLRFSRRRSLCKMLAYQFGRTNTRRGVCPTQMEGRPTCLLVAFRRHVQLDSFFSYGRSRSVLRQ